MGVDVCEGGVCVRPCQYVSGGKDGEKKKEQVCRALYLGADIHGMEYDIPFLFSLSS